MQVPKKKIILPNVMALATEGVKQMKKEKKLMNKKNSDQTDQIIYELMKEATPIYLFSCFSSKTSC